MATCSCSCRDAAGNKLAQLPHHELRSLFARSTRLLPRTAHHQHAHCSRAFAMATCSCNSHSSRIMSCAHSALDPIGCCRRQSINKQTIRRHSPCQLAVVAAGLWLATNSLHSRIMSCAHSSLVPLGCYRRQHTISMHIAAKRSQWQLAVATRTAPAS